MLNVCAAATVVLMIAQGAWAESAGAAPAPSAHSQNEGSKDLLYRQLVELRSQNALLSEQVKNAELKSKVNGPDKGQGKTVSLDQNLPIMPATSSGGAQDAPATARVQMVSGFGGNLTALLQLPNGNRVTVRVGSNVPGLGTVKSISLDDVEVENKKETIVLPFAAEASR